MASDWSRVVGVVAPTLAGALGGPLASLATNAILEVFGLSSCASDTEIDAKVSQATPAQLQDLKKAEFTFIEQMRSLDVDLEKLAVSNTVSARKREVSLGDTTPRNLAWGLIALYSIVVFFVGVISIVPDIKVDPNILTLLGAVVGYIAGEVKVMTQYYYGGSVGAYQKDKMIYQSTPLKS